MMEGLLLKAAENFGATALILLVVWKLLDKWAGQFLQLQRDQVGAMTQQANAMTDLARAVREGQGEQHEVLIAVRVLASKLDEQKAWIKELAEQREVAAR